jgi:queuine tRNA-ribosyltransferase
MPFHKNSLTERKLFLYTILHTDGSAKRAEFTTPHGTVQTPVFMNVATAAAIKGALSAVDLRDVGCQIALCNTYHLHVRPGEDVVRRMGGLRKFMAWDGVVLTDSGGFQVFSLNALRKIKEEGVYFASHVDGRKIFMGPEESMEIQAALGTTVAMAFDECAPYSADEKYMKESVARTTRWLARCKEKLKLIGEMSEACGRWPADKNTVSNSVNPPPHLPLLFGINQGGVFEDIRKNHARRISEMELDGYAIGGLAVGESHAEMYRVLDAVVPELPQNNPTYLMGVGTPENILEAVFRGVDFFDCVLPARNGRHGHAYTSAGKINLMNARYERDDTPLDAECGCAVCQTFSRAYIRHLFKAKEMLAMRLCVMHNLYFYNNLMREIRQAIEANRYRRFMADKIEKFSRCNATQH